MKEPEARLHLIHMLHAVQKMRSILAEDGLIVKQIGNAVPPLMAEAIISTMI